MTKIEESTKVKAEERLKNLSAQIRIMNVGSILCGIVTACSFVTGRPLFVFPAAILIFVLQVLVRRKKLQKKQIVYEDIKKVIAEKIDVKEYSVDRHIPESAVARTSLIPRWDEFSGSDMVQGIYRGVNIAFSDIDIVDIERDSDGDTSRETLFHGQWVVCELPKSLDNEVRIRERPNKLCKVFQKSDVETESEEFNQKYQILTRDSHTAFYILTPHFMEYILNADLMANARTYLYFGGNHVHIAIDSRKDLFEMLNKHESLDEIRSRVKKELDYLTDIVDELIKNNYLFGGTD